MSNSLNRQLGPLKPRLVIFDCDGVLVDTEAAANARMADIFTDLGHAMTADECRTLFQGRTMEGACETFADLAGFVYDPNLPALMRAEVEKVLAVTTEPVPGAIELVASDNCCIVDSISPKPARPESANAEVSAAFRRTW